MTMLVRMDRIEKEVEHLFGRKIKEALLIELEKISPHSNKPYVEVEELEEALTILLGPAGKIVIEKINKKPRKS